MTKADRLIAVLNGNTTSLEIKDFAGDQEVIGIASAHMTGSLNKLIETINKEDATLADIRYQAWLYKTSEETVLELLKS